jgi:hypothetical protein
MESTSKPTQPNRGKTYHETTAQHLTATTQSNEIPEIISIHSQQSQTSFQQSLKATSISTHTDSFSATMTASINELFNIDSLKLPPSLAPPPPTDPLVSTILTSEYEALKKTRMEKKQEYNAISRGNEDIREKVETFTTKLETDQASLIKVTAQSLKLEFDITKSKEEIRQYRVTMTDFKSKATPLKKEFDELSATTKSKKDEVDAAKLSEETAANTSKIINNHYRAQGALFVKSMKEQKDYQDWKMDKENRNISSQIEAILCVYHDLPSYFSRSELETLLGYKNGNHNVEGALDRMEAEEMLQKTTNNLGSEVYYLGAFAMWLLGRKQAPDPDSKPAEYLASINSHLDNGTKAANARKSEKQLKRAASPTAKQASSTTVKVTPLPGNASSKGAGAAKRQKTGSQQNYGSNSKRSSKNFIDLLSSSSSSDSNSDSESNSDSDSSKETTFGAAARKLAAKKLRFDKQQAATSKNSDDGKEANNSNKEDCNNNDSNLTKKDAKNDNDDNSKIIDTSSTIPSESLADSNKGWMTDLEESISGSNGSEEGKTVDE